MLGKPPCRPMQTARHVVQGPAMQHAFLDPAAHVGLRNRRRVSRIGVASQQDSIACPRLAAVGGVHETPQPLSRAGARQQHAQRRVGEAHRRARRCAHGRAGRPAAVCRPPRWPSLRLRATNETIHSRTRNQRTCSPPPGGLEHATSSGFCSTTVHWLHPAPPAAARVPAAAVRGPWHPRW